MEPGGREVGRSGDAALRGLERRWRDTGAVEDEVRWLQERARRGLVPRERLLLGAYLGSPAARAVVGAAGFPEEPDLGAWVRGLGRGRLGRRHELAQAACLRAAGAAVELALPELVAEGADVVPLERALARARQAPEPGADLARELGGLGVPGGAPRLVGPVTDLTYHLARTRCAADPREAASAAAEVAEAAAGLLRDRHRHHRQAVREAIVAALVPWVLHGDG